MQLSTAMQEFDLSRVGRSPATRAWYTRMLDPLIDFLDDAHISEITASDLRRWHVDLEGRDVRWGEQRPMENGGLSPYTINAHLRACRIFFRWLLEEGYIDSNPTRRLDVPALPDAPPKAISNSDVEKMLEMAQADGARSYAIVCFLADTACRIGGLVGLMIHDLDLEHRRAVVHEKGNHSRTVYFCEVTADTLRTWLKVRPDRGDHVFVGQRGPLTGSGVYQILKRLAKMAGVKRFNPHAFRHGWARGALERGADLGTVAHVLGHSDIHVTHKFYARWSDEELAQRHDRYSWMNDSLESDA